MCVVVAVQHCLQDMSADTSWKSAPRIVHLVGLADFVGDLVSKVAAFGMCCSLCVLFAMHPPMCDPPCVCASTLVVGIEEGGKHEVARASEKREREIERDIKRERERARETEREREKERELGGNTPKQMHSDYVQLCSNAAQPK